MVATTATGTRQLAGDASLVRAAAPHSRHQSCSGRSSAEQRGQGMGTHVRHSAATVGCSAGCGSGDAVGSQLDAARGTEARLAAVQRAAPRALADAGLVQLGDGAPVVEGVLERAQLAIDLVERGELGRDQLVVLAVEAVQVEEQAADVAEPELAHAAEVAQAAAQAPALAESRSRVGDGLGARRRVLGGHGLDVKPRSAHAVATRSAMRRAL